MKFAFLFILVLHELTWRFFALFETQTMMTRKKLNIVANVVKEFLSLATPELCMVFCAVEHERVAFAKRDIRNFANAHCICLHSAFDSRFCFELFIIISALSCCICGVSQVIKMRLKKILRNNLFHDKKFYFRLEIARKVFFLPK